MVYKKRFYLFFQNLNISLYKVETIGDAYMVDITFNFIFEYYIQYKYEFQKNFLYIYRLFPDYHRETKIMLVRSLECH
jgi:hypothetical protein